MRDLEQWIDIIQVNLPEAENLCLIRMQGRDLDIRPLFEKQVIITALNLFLASMIPCIRRIVVVISIMLGAQCLSPLALYQKHKKMQGGHTTLSIACHRFLPRIVSYIFRLYRLWPYTVSDVCFSADSLGRASPGSAKSLSCSEAESDATGCSGSNSMLFRLRISSYCRSRSRRTRSGSLRLRRWVTVAGTH